MRACANTDNLKSVDFSHAWLSDALEALSITPQDPVLLGVSGGADSVALLHALSRLERPRVRAIHINHKLRDDAHKAAQETQAIAQKMGVACTIQTVTVYETGQGLEAAARDARYKALQSALAPGEYLLLAHHAQDQAETMLLQLMRGTGLAGLSGMLPIQPFGPGYLVRPLLTLSHAALMAYVAQENLPVIEDPSNQDERFARNYIRHQIWPLLERRWPHASDAMGRAASHVQAAERLLTYYIDQDLDRSCAPEGGLLIPALLALPMDAQAMVLRRFLKRSGGIAISEAKCREILRALAMVPRSRHQVIRLGYGQTLRRYREHVSWSDAPMPESSPTWECAWVAPEERVLPYQQGRLRVTEGVGAGLSVTKIAGKELRLSGRQKGVRVRIPGRGHRVLKKFLQELGVAPWDRARIVLVFDGDLLIAVPGYFVCDGYKAAPNERGWTLHVDS